MAGLKFVQRGALIWALTNDHVSLTEKMVLLALNQYADAEGWHCYPSTTKLAKDCCLTRPTISRVLSGLAKKGFIEKTPRYAESRQTSNFYRINYEYIGGVTENDRGVTENDRECHRELQGVSSKVTGGVTENDTEQIQLTDPINKPFNKGEQKKSDTSKECFDGPADARNIQTLPHGAPSPSPESETNGKDSNADQKDICSAQSVKGPKRSRNLDGLRGNSSRQYQQAMAEKAALTLFNNDQEEQSFYQWAKQNLGKEGERQADISISRLRNKVKATPRDKELLETFRKTTSGPQKAPQQTRESRMASVAEKYKTDPSILKKDATAFHREYGVSIHNFKGYLFEVGVL